MIALLLALMSQPAHAGCTLIRGATIHGEGGASKGDLLIAGPKIAGVGSALDAKFQGEACEVVDATGKEVAAGFIEVDSELGIVEVGLEAATRDGDPEVPAQVRAALRVSDAYNPRSTLIPVQRIGGVTGALVAPRGGRVAGQAAFVSLAGATQAEAVKNPSVAMIASAGGASRAQGLRELRTVLRDARDFKTLKAAWERDQVRPLAADGADLEALWPVLDGRLPLVVHADRAADIEALLRLAAEERIRLVISGAAEGHLVAPQLAAARVPVIVDPLVYGAGGFDQVHGRADNAALLVAAGVPVILTTGSTHNARNLGQIAGNAVRGGMEHEAALAAITSVPARVFGLTERGELRVGAWADVVLWSGDPLETTSWPVAVWINGRAIPMESRQTQLRDAYLQLPGTPKPPPALP